MKPNSAPSCLVSVCRSWLCRMFFTVFLILFSASAFAFGGSRGPTWSSTWSGGINALGIHIDPDHPIVPPDFRDCTEDENNVIGMCEDPNENPPQSEKDCTSPLVWSSWKKKCVCPDGGEYKEYAVGAGYCCKSGKWMAVLDDGYEYKDAVDPDTIKACGCPNNSFQSASMKICCSESNKGYDVSGNLNENECGCASGRRQVSYNAETGERVCEDDPCADHEPCTVDGQVRNPDKNCACECPKGDTEEDGKCVCGDNKKRNENGDCVCEVTSRGWLPNGVREVCCPAGSSTDLANYIQYGKYRTDADLDLTGPGHVGVCCPEKQLFMWELAERVCCPIGSTGISSQGACCTAKEVSLCGEYSAFDHTATSISCECCPSDSTAFTGSECCSAEERISYFNYPDNKPKCCPKESTKYLDADGNCCVGVVSIRMNGRNEMGNVCCPKGSTDRTDSSGNCCDGTLINDKEMYTCCPSGSQVDSYGKCCPSSIEIKNGHCCQIPEGGCGNSKECRCL